MAALTSGLCSRSVQRPWSSMIYLLVFGGNLVSAVIIHRCCPEGLAYNSDSDIASDQCTPSFETLRTPILYSPENQTFLDAGSVPDDWQYDVGRPLCSEPKFFSLEPDTLRKIVSSIRSEEEEVSSFSIKFPFFLHSNGSLVIKEPRVILDQTRFCIDPLGAIVCFGHLKHRATVQKCCGLGRQFNETSPSCTTAVNDHPEFTRLNVVAGFPNCSARGTFVIPGSLNETHWLREDGHLADEKGSILNQSQFCLETFAGHPEGPINVFTCPKIPDTDVRFTLYPIGLILSVVCLAVILIASFPRPMAYHVLHWRCQTNYVACLLIGDLLLAIAQLSGSALRGHVACSGIAIAMHFTFLAAFFWLNTMCFNIWSTLRDFRLVGLDRRQETFRLRLYELYAWGGPLLIAGVGTVLDNLPAEGVAHLIRPQFGVQRCWFYGDKEIFYYFYGPVGVLLFLNLTLFVATAIELTWGRWKIEAAKSENGEKSNSERVTLGRVCLKLVIVMGVTWLAEVVSWAVGGPNYLWYSTDLINSIQGVLLFAVVGPQLQVRAALKRLCCLSNSSRDNTNVKSSSSQAPSSLDDENKSLKSASKDGETPC